VSVLEDGQVAADSPAGGNQERVGDVILAVEHDVVRATIDRPDRKNAISLGVIRGLEWAVDVAVGAAARVLVIRGAGGTFCAGADLRELESMRDTPDRLTMFMARLSAVLHRLETAPFVSVAVVEGHAVAGGCEIVLACDVSIAALDAQIGDRHLEYGLVPAAGGAVRLARTLPRARGNYLLLSAELLSGREAADWGLVSLAVPASELEQRVTQLVHRLANRSHAALATVKKMTWSANQGSQSEAMAAERMLFLRHMTSSDVDEGLAAFREHRSPAFRPAG
jgi:enoyl-CoA hydratase/carnithine racemase